MSQFLCRLKTTVPLRPILMAIKTVIKYPNRFVLVFDEEGEQVPEYQGLYSRVKRRILRDASETTKFKVWNGEKKTLRKVSREEW